MEENQEFGFDDAEEELKRMEEFRKAQAEVEQAMLWLRLGRFLQCCRN